MRTLSSAAFFFRDCYDVLDDETLIKGELLNGSYGSKSAESICVFLHNRTSGFVVADRCLRQRWDGAAPRRASASR
jgi:hypothetical protein